MITYLEPRIIDNLTTIFIPGSTMVQRVQSKLFTKTNGCLNNEVSLSKEPTEYTHRLL